MNTCCSMFTEIAGRQFDVTKARRELTDYRENGAGVTTRLLRDGLVAADVVRGPLIDVGAGVGPLAFELLDRGVSRAILVEASAASLSAAGEEADRRGCAHRVECVHGDFLDLAPTLPRAAVVTLDRVVCCYALAEPLLARAVERAGRAVALSYPRDVLLARAAVGADNLIRRLSGSTFRTFVHSPARIERIVRGAGFELSSRRETWMWRADVYVRVV